MPPPRPPTFMVTSSDTATGGADFSSRQESALLPGEVRTPAIRPTPLVGDWTRGDSTVWETRDDGPSCTPLNSYGRDNLWGIAADADGGGAASNGGPEGTMPDDDSQRVRSTIQQALAVTSGFDDNAGAYPSVRAGAPNGAHHQPYSNQQAQQYGSSYQAYTAPPNMFTVQHTNDSQAVRELSREVSATELGSRQSTSDASLLAKFRSQSEIISDELYFQAKTFPPPPPSSAPMETRRIRAELWYLIARKWDITQQMPPPPRSPLPGMEEEHRLKLQELTRVPYRGDRWLAQADRWFQSVHTQFRYPEENIAVVLPTPVVLSMCA